MVGCRSVSIQIPFLAILHFLFTPRFPDAPRSIPDFVVVSARGNLTFVEVKFRSDPEWLKGTNAAKDTTKAN
jgi:hypothetical protein